MPMLKSIHPFRLLILVDVKQMVEFFFFFLEGGERGGVVEKELRGG